VLVALGASIEIAGPRGSRSLALQEFYRIPGKPGEREHDLAPNEMVIRLRLPPPARGSWTAYYEVRQKHGFDWPLATATVSFQIEHNRVTSAVVVLGHVAPMPWRSKEAEASLIGKVIDEQVASDASNAALQSARNLGQNGYKIQVARVALKRAILEAAGEKVPSIHPRGARS